MRLRLKRRLRLYTLSIKLESSPVGYRQILLDKIHKGQKEIDCLDYLVYQIEESKGKIKQL